MDLRHVLSLKKKNLIIDAWHPRWGGIIAILGIFGIIGI